MLSEIRLTQHAGQKFDILRRHGFPISREQVEQTLLAPDAVWRQEGGRFIAQKAIGERHVLRVVYRMEADTVIVITFYPGLRERYESDL